MYIEHFVDMTIIQQIYSICKLHCGSSIGALSRDWPSYCTCSYPDPLVCILLSDNPLHILYVRKENVHFLSKNIVCVLACKCCRYVNLYNYHHIYKMFNIKYPHSCTLYTCIESSKGHEKSVYVFDWHLTQYIYVTVR